VSKIIHSFCFGIHLAHEQIKMIALGEIILLSKHRYMQEFLFFGSFDHHLNALNEIFRNTKSFWRGYSSE
jgi:hypothetical protein